MTFSILASVQQLVSPSASSSSRRRRRRYWRGTAVPQTQESLDRYLEHRQWLEERNAAKRKKLVVSTLLYKKVVATTGNDEFDNTTTATTTTNTTTPTRETPPQEQEPVLARRSKDDITIADNSNDQEDEDDEADNSIVCAICLQCYEDGDEICWSQNPNCYHAFHSKCIENWLAKHDNCPCCKNNYMMLPTQDVKIENAPNKRVENVNSESTSQMCSVISSKKV